MTRKWVNILLSYVLIYLFVAFVPVLDQEIPQDPTISRPYYKKSRLLRTVRKRISQFVKRIDQFFDPYASTWWEYKRRKRNTTQKRKLQFIRRVEEICDSGGVRLPRIFPRHLYPKPRLKRLESSWSSIRVMSGSAPSTNSRGEPWHDNVTHFDTDAASIGIDNRCSACISHVIDDFEGPLTKVSRSIKGFGGTRVSNVMIGTLLWRWCDDEGKIHKFRIPHSYYVPQGKTRLLSPQHWAKSQGSARQHVSETTMYDKCILRWANGQLTVPISKKDNCATFALAPGYNKFSLFCQECKLDYNASVENPITVQEAGIVSDDENDDDDIPPSTHAIAQPRRSLWSRVTGLPLGKGNASDNQQTSDDSQTRTDFNLDGPAPHKPVIIEAEEEKQATTDTDLLLRYHHRFAHLSFAKLQEMAKQNVIPTRLAKCQVPVCTACLYAKATKRRWRDKQKKGWTKPPNAAKEPGDVVSVDQLVSPTPGLIAHMTGRPTRQRYKYATIFVDQYSSYTYVYLQKTASADETILGKLAFEADARSHGVKIKHYHADNGIFRAAKWMDACAKANQGISFAGVNAHHTNGHAERKIRSLQDLTRASLIHANARWRSVNVHLWPYALRTACEALNDSPNLKDVLKRAPRQIFTKNEHLNVNSKHWKPFGCPVYVLDDALQGSSRIFGKWKIRSNLGIYLGKSPLHGRNVALVLNRTTGLVSPQFHVTFDPSFRTAKDDKYDDMWMTKTGFTAEEKKPTKKGKLSPVTRSVETPLQQMTDSEGVTRKRKRELTPKSAQPNAQQQSTIESNPSTLQQQGDKPGENETPQMSSEMDDNHPKVPKPTNGSMLNAMLAEIEQSTKDGISEIFAYQTMFAADMETLWTEDLVALKATTDPDTMYHHQAMNQPDADKFKDAMQKEWDDQHDNGNFTVIRRTSVPEGATVLPAVWQMKRKRDIRTRRIKKYKARLNIDGSRMKHGQHYDFTYAPVASWNSIRSLLILTALFGWHTRQIDYVLAFPQAPVEREIYMEIPRGFEIKGENTRDYVLKLHRNIYGQKQAGRVWNKYLTDILVNKVGFTQSKVDECVFYRGSVMYVLYTDDSILGGPNLKEIEQAIEDIKAAKLDITVEGDLQDFLGINIDRKADGSIELTQPHLVDQILEDLKMGDETKVKTTPAKVSTLLSRHTNSPDFDNSFNMRSVVGKLNYLEKGSRADIAYATHQIARFVSCPKREHGEAVRWLARYLKGTRNKGTILRPDKSRGLEVFVDADFAGNWDKEETSDPDTARSRHGYVIMFAGCPILWKSQLQTEFALSSTESEITGLSYSLRDAIPIMNLFKEMMSQGIAIKSNVPKVHCKVFEDNTGAIEIARVPKFRPRTKHMHTKLMHFRSYVDVTKEITIHKIHTSEQPADILTKSLSQDLFEYLRKKIMGW